MKKFVISLLILFTGLQAQVQQSDLDLANMLIGQDINDLDSILKITGYDYTVTDVAPGKEDFTTIYTFYLDSNYGGVKLWELLIRKPYEWVGVRDRYKRLIEGEPAYISQIFVRYRNGNVGDLKDFKSFEISKNDTIEYEKEMGKNLSHLKVEYRKRVN